MRSPAHASKWRLLLVAAGATLLVSACASAVSPTPVRKGGTVTFAEQPTAPPNYILPLASSSYFTVANLSDFSQDMYLPLYWFGKAGEPVLNKGLSVAEPPVFSDHNSVVTLNLKHWSWSNGQPVTARDVIFWMNLLSAATDPLAPTVGTTTSPGPGWGAAVPGGFPQNVASYTQTGTYQLQLKLNASYNPTWYTDNELSQIYPLPQAAWDRLSAGGTVGNYDSSAQSRALAPASAHLPAGAYLPTDPGSASSGALGVAQFLNLQSQDLSTYATNPLWKVVDGPFVLRSFTPSGYAKLVPNSKYSGSPKPTISAFVEEPFTSDTAEYNALRTKSLTIGYIPPQDLGTKSTLEALGYRLAPWYEFGVNYSPYNFTNPTIGPVFKQLYVRQAIQSLINQPQYIKDFMGGIGAVGNGPVPSYPHGNPDQSPLEAKGQVYPYDPGRAVNLLKSHGWKVVPRGTTSCVRPGSAAGQCGTGIHLGQPLSFTMLYVSGSTELTSRMEALQSTLAAQAGITMALKSAPFGQVASQVAAGCTFATPCSTWGMSAFANFIWVYSPDYLPTGGELFATGAGSNFGDYSSPTNNANILGTHTASTASAEQAALFRYQNYLAQQLPVAWMPSGPYQLTMYRSNLRGLVPQGIFAEIYPQLYSFAG